MINWNKLTVEDVKCMADWAIRIGFFHFAKELIKDLEDRKKLVKSSKHVMIST